MLISFSVSNFRSFNDEVTFSLVASKRITDHANHLEAIPGSEAKVLRAGVIYGANGAGKSNFFKALLYFKKMATKTRRKDGGTGRTTFRFSSNNETLSVFDVQFFSNGATYRYGIELDDQRIHDEWLVTVENEHEITIFDRKTDDKGAVTIEAPGLIKENEKLNALVTVGGPQNQTFLATIASTLGQTDYGVALSDVINWFNISLNFIAPDNDYAFLAADLYNKKDLNEFVNNFIKSSSTGLDKIDVSRDEIDEGKLKTIAPEIYADVANNNDTDIVYYLTHNKDIIVDNKEGRHYYSYTPNAIHEHETGNAQRLDLSDESDGTNRLLNLLPALHFMRSKNDSGNVFIIDEIDRSMHPLLVLKFLEFFLSGCSECGGQLILTTHDTHILDSELVRRDEVWFAEKNEHGATQMYSLSDFKPRNDVKLGKNYLQGRFGAIPYLGRIDALIHENGVKTSLE
jgi:uncharacterized protein